jgi:hypothetical protein
MNVCYAHLALDGARDEGDEAGEAQGVESQGRVVARLRVGRLVLLCEWMYVNCGRRERVCECVCMFVCVCLCGEREGFFFRYI